MPNRTDTRERSRDVLEAQFKPLYTSGIIGIIRADTEQITDANDAFLRMVGYTRQELEAGELRWPEMTPPEYADLDARALEELMATGTCAPFQKEYTRKDGTRVPVLIAATSLGAASSEWVCYVLDLSATKRTATTERTLETIIEHVPVGIIVVDPTGRLVLMNQAGRVISGDSPDRADEVASQAETYALRDPETGRPLAPAETPIGRAVAGEIVENFEYVFRPVGAATDSWIRAVAVPLSDVDGRRLGAVAVFQDVTEERIRERTRESFLSTVAHDLKTPLTSIKGFSQLLERRLMREGVLRTEAAQPALQHITDTVTRMEGLIGELLDVARLQAGVRIELNPDRVDLVELVRQVADEWAQVSDHHRITVEASPSTIVGVWDGVRLGRVIGNLVGNAVTYSPEGGDITLNVAREEIGGEAWAVVRVADQGIGIPDAELPRIFERFYRGSNVVGQFSGTGIGLAGVKLIVEQHGGRVTVESREGIGSTFTICLPLDQARSSP